MKADDLIALAKQFHENRAFITNEETAKMSLVVPFIRLLGYDPNRPREVRLEYCAEFTQGDGKRYPDRMDFAIFDQSGARPLLVIETKPLGADLRARSQQLARYIAQLPNLRFGIITDGCQYLFYGDLVSPNVMDDDPFFAFSLDDAKADWQKIAAFLVKFSRDSFNAETLVTDAENSRYRQDMIKKLVQTLRDPGGDEEFMKWLTTDVYKGVRTQRIRDRMNELARDAMEPALLRVIGDDFVTRLREKIYNADPDRVRAAAQAESDDEGDTDGAESDDHPVDSARRGIVTTQAELQFFDIVRQIVARTGGDASQVMHKDTTGYFNVSYARPTKWFVRYFGDVKRPNLTTLVPAAAAAALAPGFEVEESPAAFGASRIYIDDVAQVWGMEGLIRESLRLLIDE